MGKVTAVGKDVETFKVGESVGVGCLVDACRTCGSCNEGFENYGENGWIGTDGSALPDDDYTKGGYSDRIVVDQRFVLHIPDNLDLAAAAPLLCAGITTYSPLKHVGVTEGDKVAVLDLGGLGHMGVKLAVSFRAAVTVLSRSPHKQADVTTLHWHQLFSGSIRHRGSRCFVSIR